MPGFAALTVLAVLAAPPAPAPAPAAADSRPLKLVTTTTTDNSGLLKVLLPAFEAKTGIKVEMAAMATGKALKQGENGEVDVLLVHSRADEDKFVKDGWGVNRKDVMYNEFILLGPKSDPAKIVGGKDVTAALKKIGSGSFKFVSRGDDSATDKKEKSLWSATGIKPKGPGSSLPWYISAGKGPAETLTVAGEMKAYTLSDRGTFKPLAEKTGLVLAVQGDSKLSNPYGVIAVNPEQHPKVNHKAALAFITWITSKEGQAVIAGFKVDGEQVFFPSAK